MKARATILKHTSLQPWYRCNIRRFPASMYKSGYFIFYTHAHPPPLSTFPGPLCINSRPRNINSISTPQHPRRLHPHLLGLPWGKCKSAPCPCCRQVLAPIRRAGWIVLEASFHKQCRLLQCQLFPGAWPGASAQVRRGSSAGERAFSCQFSLGPFSLQGQAGTCQTCCP